MQVGLLGLGGGAGEGVLLVLALVGKFGVSCSLAIMFVYTAELVPTRNRSAALGLCSLFARLGGMLAPQLLRLPSPLTAMGEQSPVFYFSLFPELH